MSKLPENIKNFRILRGLSQKQLADMLHKSPNVISNWERGINSPEVDLVETMCEIFNCSPNEMFGWEESKELTMIEEFHHLQKEKDDILRRLTEYSRLISDYQKRTNTDV